MPLKALLHSPIHSSTSPYTNNVKMSVRSLNDTLAYSHFPLTPLQTCSSYLLRLLRLAKFYDKVSPACQRCQHPSADLIHVFWLCPSLYKYWKEVFNTISAISGENVEPDAFGALFGVFPSWSSKIRLSLRGSVTDLFLFVLFGSFLFWCWCFLLLIPLFSYSSGSVILLQCPRFFTCHFHILFLYKKRLFYM